MYLFDTDKHVLINGSIYYFMKELCNMLSELNKTKKHLNHRYGCSLKILFRTNAKLVHLETLCSDVPWGIGYR